MEKDEGGGALIIVHLWLYFSKFKPSVSPSNCTIVTKPLYWMRPQDFLAGDYSHYSIFAYCFKSSMKIPIQKNNILSRTTIENKPDPIFW